MAEKEDAIKTKLVIEGEKEYKAACAEINSSLRLIGSEMKVVSAEFAGNEKSIEGLTAKQDILRKKLDEQSKAVNVAEDALKKMLESGVDPASPSYQRMEIALNNAKVEMIKTQKEIENTSDGLKKSKVNWEDVGETVKTVGAAFATSLAALGTAALGAAAGLAKLTVDAADFADDLLTQSTYTRQSTDDLQKYAYACRFIDTDMDTLTKTMTKNIKSMDSASNGTGVAAEAYNKLGVSVTNADGSLRDSNDVYWETIDALGQVKNETERDAMAMQLFGKSAQELNSVINAGSQAFKDLGAEAESMGAVMGEKALNSLGEFKDKLDILEASTEGLKNSASLIALPFLDTLASEGIPILTQFSKGISDAGGDISKMGDVLGEGISGMLNIFVKKLPEFIDMGVQIVQSLIKGVADNAPVIAQSAVNIVESLVNGIAELLPIIINGAVQIVVGLAQGIGQSLPVLIPKITEMVTSIIQTLIENIPLLINAALQLVLGLAKGIINAIPVLVEAIPEIINSILTAILDSIPLIIQAGIDLLTALIEALPQIITAIVEAIPLIIDGIITAVIDSIPLIIQAGIDLLIALIEALPQIIITIVNAIPQIVSGICEALINNIDKIILAGVQLFIALIENLPTIIIEIVKAVPQIIAGIVGAFNTLLPKIVEIGGNLLRGIWEGISAAGDWLKEKINGFFNGMVDGVKNVLGIHSPSKVFEEKIGKQIVEGLAVGINKNSEKAQQAAEEMASDIQDKSFVTSTPVGENLVQGIIDGLMLIKPQLEQEAINIGTETVNNRVNAVPQMAIAKTADRPT